MTQRQVPTVHTLQVLLEVVDMPVVVQQQVLGFFGTENCGGSAVPVRRWSSTSPSCCRGSSPWSALSMEIPFTVAPWKRSVSGILFAMVSQCSSLTVTVLR